MYPLQLLSNIFVISNDSTSSGDKKLKNPVGKFFVVEYPYKLLTS